MKKQNKLIRFDDTRKDLLYWVKQFLIDKIIHTTKEHISDDFDMASYVQRLSSNDADTIEKVKSIVDHSIKNGLKSIKVPLRVVASFYSFIDQNATKFPSIKDISSVTLTYFVREENAKASDAKKNELHSGVRNLFNFIDDNNQDEFLFHIAKDSTGKAIKATNRKVQRKKIPVYLTEKEMKRFHDTMLKIEYRSVLERNRDILIGRVLLFSGIQLSELIALKDDDLMDDVEHIDTIWLHIPGKGASKRKIPMPRKRLIVYLNAYKEARGENINGRMFFHSLDPKKEIVESTVRNVIEKLGKAAGIAKEKCKPTVLRNTFGIFVYRHMMMEGNPNADRYVQEVMGHSDIQVTRWLVKFENPKMILAADAFAGFIDNNRESI